MNKTRFPEPPAGRIWHNPENYTPEQIEVDKGFEPSYTYRTKNPLPVPEVEISETQKAFEDWANEEELNLSKNKYGSYSDDETYIAYQAWMAAANPVAKPTEKLAPTWNRDDNVITMRIINSTDEENSHYYTVQINEFGCVQLQMFSFDGGELLESFSMSPEDSLLIAESLKFISDEEIKKAAF